MIIIKIMTIMITINVIGRIRIMIIIIMKSIFLKYSCSYHFNKNYKLLQSILIINNERTLVGTFCTYYLLISMMTIALVIAPQTASYMPHSGQNSSGTYVRTWNPWRLSKVTFLAWSMKPFGCMICVRDKIHLE